MLRKNEVLKKISGLKNQYGKLSYLMGIDRGKGYKVVIHKNTQVPDIIMIECIFVKKYYHIL